MEQLSAIQQAFTRQSLHYDRDDLANPILVNWRQRVYSHVKLFMQPGSHILELNAGTGIDALHYVNEGHQVLATDISPGMIAQLRKKAITYPDRFKVQQCSFEEINILGTRKFDYVFSNMGGLNCCQDLSLVANNLPGLIYKNAFVTWVIMPPCCPWEWLSILKGKKTAFRRLQKNGAMAHLEGEYFKTYYHSLSAIKTAFGKRFKLLRAEGLGCLSPPPSSQHVKVNYPALSRFLERFDQLCCRHFPFNRLADHIIVTFQYLG